MKAHGFVQIIPDRDSTGRARSLKIERVTSKHPYSPLPGAIIAKVSIDVPEEVANAQTIEAVAEAGALSVVVVEGEADAA